MISLFPRLCLCIFLEAISSVAAAPSLDRPLRYHPDGTDFVITNGAEFFNRPLYGTNSAFRVDAGDKPEFSLYLPGRGGNLRLGIVDAKGGKWLSEAATIITRYRPGGMAYEIRDPLLGDGVLTLNALPLAATEGLIVRAELRGPAPAVDLVWAYGGASGERGKRDGDIGTERLPVSQFFQLTPEACRGSRFDVRENRFTLRAKAAQIEGFSSPGGKFAVADARQWASPAALLATAGKSAGEPVVVGRISLPVNQPRFIALQRVARAAGSGDELQIYKDVTAPRPGATPAAAESKLAAPYRTEELPALFAAAEARRARLAGQVVIETPDPFLNAAAAALNVAADGVWDEDQGAVMHGAVAWRVKLLGWRGPYALDALGWHDRARRHLGYWAGRQNDDAIPEKFPPAATTDNLARNEPALHSNGDMSNSHYDMNLPYIDALLRHLEWTGDLEMARKVWPVIERHLAWERRLFRREFGPDKLPLYEAYCCIWASDDLAYNGGGATHSTAYNLYHNRQAARLAKLLGKDPAPYEREADLIARGMREQLWLPDRGWFGEWKDLLGLQAVHPSAALWTFYHTVDSEAASPFEAWQMTRFVDTQIAHIPVRGPGVPAEGLFTLPTTNWMPYTWSTNNVVMAETAHTALAYWQAGRPDQAMRMFKGAILDSMFLGLCPGNAGMTTYYDRARGESQRDFADSTGMLARAFVEGLFGIRPDLLGGSLVVRPGFPADWARASLHQPDVDLSFRRDGDVETYRIDSRFTKPPALRFELSARRSGVAEVKVNGKPAAWKNLPDAVGSPRIEITSPAAALHEVVIHWRGVPVAMVQNPPAVVTGAKLQAAVGAARVEEIADPQGALSGIEFGGSELSGLAVGTPGHRTVFVRVRQDDLAWWLPVEFEIQPAFELVGDRLQQADSLRFRIRNHTADPVRGDAAILGAGWTEKQQLDLPAGGESPQIVLRGAPLPGTNPVAVSLPGDLSVNGLVTNWQTSASAGVKFTPIDLVPHFNDRLIRIFRNDYLSPRSPYVSLALARNGFGSWCKPAAAFDVDDAGLRAAAGAGGGRIVLPQGIPFVTPGPGDAKNIIFTSRWDNYPAEAAVALTGRARHAYFLMAGSTDSMKSRFDNGEVIVGYADGTTARLVLNNPTNWWPIDQDYLIDDYAFRRPEPVPPRVDLRTGKVRTRTLADFDDRGLKIPGGAATVLDLPLDPAKELRSVTVRALANEVVIGLMSVTLAGE